MPVMPRRSVLSLHLASVLALGLCALMQGCSPPGVPRPTPPDPDQTSPPPLMGGQYGSGSGGMQSPPPVCPVTQRQCPTAFAYAGSKALPLTGKESAVVLAGDFDSWGKGQPMTYDMPSNSWKTTLELALGGEITYKFHISYSDGTADQWVPDPTNPDMVSDGLGGMNSQLMGITCAKYDCGPPVTQCRVAAPQGYDWRDAVIYFVFVDRFLDGDTSNDTPVTAGVDPIANYEGGDWAGVTQKINEGYFNDLGVNTLWVTVPMDNTNLKGLGTPPDTNEYSAYHGYWPRDLDNPEFHFGTLVTLKALVDAAHAKGLKVLFDYSMHHVTTDSPIWLAHMNDGWFNPLMVSGQECICGSAICPWDGLPGTQCWFTDYLPDFNFTNAAARSYSVGNAMAWFNQKLAPTSVDGFRLDAVKNIDISWVTAMRTALNAVEATTHQHPYLVGETYTGDQSVIQGYVDPATMLDGQFDFPLRAALNPVILMRQNTMQTLAGFMDGNTCYYGNAIMSTFLGNQDVPRTIHFAEDTPLWTDPWADGKERGWTNQPTQPTSLNPYQRMAEALTILWTNRGAPLLYYGDEIGLAGAGDPDNRRMMQWDPAKYNAGQTALLATVKALGAIRAAHTALRRGDRTTLSVTNDTWVYRMEDDPDVVYVAVNRSDAAQPAAGLPGMALKELLTGTMVNGSAANIPARGALILTQ